MPGSSRLVAFVATADADRARAFHEGQPGLALRQDDGCSLMFDARGTQRRIQRVDNVAPQPYTALGREVDDLAGAARSLAARGVATARIPGLPLDADGIRHTPDGSRVARFHDPDGNTLSIHQPPAP
jgi:catechol 2,3-dioxygenase-like lactoylglutathione lyase family enzyme